MNPNYYRALKQARNCNEKDIKGLQNFIVNPKNNLDEETKDNLKRLENFIKYAKNKDEFGKYESEKYWNIFEVFKIGKLALNNLSPSLIFIRFPEFAILFIVKLISFNFSFT